jgi:hypothetical protein
LIAGQEVKILMLPVMKQMLVMINNKISGKISIIDILMGMIANDA